MEEKVAIITGGTKGIGLGIANVFVREGFKVALIYRSDKAQAEKAVALLGEDRAIAIKVDVTQVSALEPMLAQVEKHFGCAGVLVNNAGILRSGQLLDIEETDLREVMECNFFAPLYLTRAIAKRCIEHKLSASVVNVLTIGAHRGGNLAYCSAKAALLNATKSMARELARHKIRVNSISPFGCETELNRDHIKQNPEGWQKMLKKPFLKRASEPEEIGEAVYFLASDKASYITGTDLPVDGGYLAG